MNAKSDPYGRDATRPYQIPLKGWWQVAQRVGSESVRDNLSLVAAGCAFYALLAISPILPALISLYALTMDPLQVEQRCSELRSTLNLNCRPPKTRRSGGLSQWVGEVLLWPTM
jgi:membrane protein